MSKAHYSRQPFLLLLLLFLSLSAAAFAAVGPSVLIAGYESDNVVQFDLTTGKWTEIARLPEDSHPRGIAVNESGEIFVGLNGGQRNLVKLELGENSTHITDVTGPIGRFGPGILAAGKGSIWAAGDTDRVIYQINPASGEVTAPSQYRNCCNLVGLAASGDVLYTAEYFQRSILRYDLKNEPASADRFIKKSPHLNRPVGLVIGHNGNLFVANKLEPTVIEFDIKTGEYVRTFTDLGLGGKDGIHGLIYVKETKRYYLASGSTLHETDENGTVTASYSSPALKKAYGIALVPAGARLARSKTPPPPKSSATRTPAQAAAAIAATPIPAPVLAPVEMPHKPVTLLRLNPQNPGQLSIAGTPGKRYRVMATTDFQIWDAIAEVANATGELHFQDTEAAHFDKRFYRLEEINPTK